MEGQGSQSQRHVICSVLPRSAEEALPAVERAPAGCSLVELRADRLRPDEIAGIVHRSSRSLVVTLRRREDGGGFDGAESERERALRAALGAGAAFVDLEWDRPVASIAAEPGFRGRTILSDHGTRCESAALRTLLREMSGRGAAVLKIAAAADDVDQCLAVRDLLADSRGAGTPLAAFALGRAGTPSRLLGPSWGSWATYGSLTPDDVTGPGQLQAAHLLDPYDVLGIGPRTRIHALVGSRVSGSPSPAMHLAGYRELGLDARYFAIETDDFEAFARLAESETGLGLSGFGVTMPFKREAAARCEPGDDLARASGAVNTVLAGPGRWTGFNTDGPGALDCLGDRVAPGGTRVALLGAGGTARAVAAALVVAGAHVTLFNRTPEHARDAARATGAEWASLSALDNAGWDVLVHATPQGSDGRRFLDPDLLRGRVVLDVVYARSPTPLVRDARQRGLEVIDGLEMLAAQAARQFRLLTGHAVGRDLLRCTATAWIGTRPLDAPQGPQ